jgi:hypothetical protein
MPRPWVRIADVLKDRSAFYWTAWPWRWQQYSLSKHRALLNKRHNFTLGDSNLQPTEFLKTHFLNTIRYQYNRCQHCAMPLKFVSHRGKSYKISAEHSIHSRSHS